MSVTYEDIHDYMDAIVDEFPHDDTATPYTVWPLTARVRAINEARERIAEYTETIPMVDSFTTAAGTYQYDINTNMYVVDRVELKDGSELTKLIGNRDGMWSRSLSDTATPTYYYVEEDGMHMDLIPPPSGIATVYVYGKALPDAMTWTNVGATLATTSKELQIPVHLRKHVVTWALAKGYDRDGIVDGKARADGYKKQFFDEMKVAVAKNKQNRFRGTTSRLNVNGYNPRDSKGYK